jgi:RsiW-degrading membrane proteinase PrsW (M82 family)
MKVLEATIIGAICAAGLVAWAGAGYLIQRYLLRNPNPGGAQVILTAMAVTMAGFAIVSFWFGYWPASH